MKVPTICCMLALGCATVAAPAHAAILYTGAPILENFDGLSTGSTSGLFANVGEPVDIPGGTGWVGSKMGGSGGAMGYRSDDDASVSSTGAVNGIGPESPTVEKALGMLTSGSQSPGVGIEIVNSSGAALTEVTISFWQENWRGPGSGAGAEMGTINTTFASYGTTASGITSATIFTDNAGYTGVSALDLVSLPPIVDNDPNPGDHSAVYTVDGNDVANRVLRTATIDLSASPIADGQSFFLRFIDPDDAPGADASMAIDDFQFSAVPEPSSIVLIGIAAFVVGAARVRRGRKAELRSAVGDA